jgi:hypothetical protein
MQTAKAWSNIHLISIFSITLERIVLERLMSCGDTSLTPTQFGCTSRAIRGTIDVVALFQNWLDEANKRKFKSTLVVGDLEGGFDKIDLRILMAGGIIPSAYHR